MVGDWGTGQAYLGKCHNHKGSIRWTSRLLVNGADFGVIGAVASGVAIAGNSRSILVSRPSITSRPGDKFVCGVALGLDR